MAQIDCTLPNDELVAFMNEMDGDWLHDPAPATPPSVGALNFDPVSPSPSKTTRKPRRYRRLELMNVRNEIAELQSELQLAHEKAVFCESLNADRSSCRLCWKLVALREKIMKIRANEENARLRARVDMQTKLISRIMSVVRQQSEAVPRSFYMYSGTSSVDLQDHDQVHRALLVSLDMRCEGDLDLIVQQCHEESVASDSNLERSRWNTFALSDRGVGIEFHEAVALPFSGAVIYRTFKPHTVSYSLEERKGNVTHNHQCPHHGVPSIMDGRLNLRRIVNVGKSSILLWEDAYWQNDASSAHLLVRSSGWAYVSPVVGHEDEMSFIFCGGNIQIHTTDESTLKASSAKVKTIGQFMQSLQRSRVSCMEESLLLPLEAGI